ncbi:MAG: hypothetical protein WAN04_14930, partial [Candidatus Udaeobacter sp.]
TLALLLPIGEAYADGRREFDHPTGRYAIHNGSLMSVETDGVGGVYIRYVEPKPSLYSWGVVPGTLLFDGHWRGPYLEGTARVFGCGPVPYFVRGTVGPDGVLVLTGPSPVVAIWPFCGPIGLTQASGNSVLIFYPQNGAPVRP